MAKNSSAKGKVVLYTSKLMKDGTHPAMLRITYKQKRWYYTTGYYATKTEWKILMSEDCPKKLENKKLEILGIQTEAIKTIRLLELEQGFFNINEFEKRFFKTQDEIPLIPSLQKILDEIDEKQEIAPRTVRSYGDALSALQRFQKNKSSIKRPITFYLQDVTKDFIKDFERFLRTKDKSNSKNKRTCGNTSIGIYTAGFRALYNRAIKKYDFKPATDPFDGFKRKRGSSNPRGLSKEDVLKFYEYSTKIGSPEWLAQQYFIFCYLNQGMNFTDLALLEWKKNIGKERLAYTRNKTKGHSMPDVFSIKISEETQAILDYFSNHKSNTLDYVFPILDDKYSPKIEMDKIDQKVGVINKYLKRIGKALGIEQKITTYVSRHTYATTLLNNNVPLHIIQEKLGHGEIRTTRGYAKRLNHAALDDVNENLLK